MNYNRYKLSSIASTELDQYLEKGWYRMGLSIFTTQYLIFDKKIYSAIWLRLPLFGYSLRKSHRKLINKVENRFTVKIGNAHITEEKELLFETYKLNFKGDLFSSLKMYMQDNENYNIYNTKECCVYDNENLIAFSFFDIGEKSTAGILAAYNHNYANFSLGIYTMLKEILFSKANNLEYYYPGYFVPYYKRFDYKCNLGETEYFNYYIKRWLPLKNLTDNQNLAVGLKEKIYDLYKQVKQNGVNTFIILYKCWELGDFCNNEGQIYNHPLFLLCEKNQLYYVAEYCPLQDYYRLSLLKKPKYFRYTQNKQTFENELILEIHNLLECDTFLFSTVTKSEIVKFLSTKILP